MLDGLWTATFASSIDAYGEGGLSEGSGIIIFDNGRIFGGDTLYYYVGAYEDVVDHEFKGKMHVNRYMEDFKKGSIFGNLAKFDLEFVAEIEDGVMLGTGKLVQYPNLSFVARLVKRADLTVESIPKQEV